MYVIGGKCKWGVATKFINNVETAIQKTPIAIGRKIWNDTNFGGGKEAAALAEKIVASVSIDQIHASRFMRVDMIKRNEGGWYINELEFFGNAYIHFEAFDNTEEFLEEMAAVIVNWIILLVK